MKIFLLSILLLTTLFAKSTKVCFYTVENNIENFKALKVNFDKYLRRYGDYEFQAFEDKKIFDNYVKNEDVIVVLSSWHYQNLIHSKRLDARLIAKKNNSIKDIKILVGKRDKPFDGLVTSAYSKKDTNKLLRSLKKDTKNLSTLVVPKDIDALMSVGFGMSDFAIVSKDSFTYLLQINTFLTKDFMIYKEVASRYRMIIAFNKDKKENEKIISIFEDMDKDKNGKNILNFLRIDEFIVIDKNLVKLGGRR